MDIQNKGEAARGWIDVHHHFWTPKHIREHPAVTPNQAANQKIRPADSIEAMDEAGVATAFLSSQLTSLWPGDREHYRRVTRECNDYAAELVRDYPGRFGLFAGLPLRDTDDSLREIEYALDVLKADAVQLYTNYGDRWLGDRSFEPVMAELNRRKVVAFVHACAPPFCRGLLPGIGDGVIEYETDTTRAIANLVFSGGAAGYPDIRFLFSRGGGTMPHLYDKLEILAAGTRSTPPAAEGALDCIHNFCYDLADASYPRALTALRTIVAPTQMLFGSDYPIRGIAEHVALLDAYGFSAEDLQAIGRDNASRLFPRLASRLA